LTNQILIGMHNR